MADLQLNRRWEPYAPALGENQSLERPFFFELACGLTKAELRKLDDDMSRLLRERHSAAFAKAGKPMDAKDPKEWSEQLAEALVAGEIDVACEVLEPFVRLGSEPLTIGGQPIKTLREYFVAVSAVSDQTALMEPLAALRRANTLEGQQEVFSKRLSGGFSITRDPSAARKGSRGAAH